MSRSSEIRGAILLALLSIAWPGPAAAQSVAVSASEDATLYAEGDLANGGGQYLFAGLTANGRARRSLLRFDVAAAVPPGFVVESATLTLTLDRTIVPATPIAIHRLLASWGEGSIDVTGREGDGADAESGDATWADRFHPDVSWSVAGGDFAPAPSATSTAGGPSAVVFSGGAMVADVQAWLDDASSNQGWILVGDESTVPTAKRFASRQSFDPAMAPVLVVGVRPPSIPTLSPVVLGLWGLLLGGAGLHLIRRA